MNRVAAETCCGSENLEVDESYHTKARCGVFTVNKNRLSHGYPVTNFTGSMEEFLVAKEKDTRALFRQLSLPGS